jgi:hypothetical protein
MELFPTSIDAVLGQEDGAVVSDGDKPILGVVDAVEIGAGDTLRFAPDHSIARRDRQTALANRHPSIVAPNQAENRAGYRGR